MRFNDGNLPLLTEDDLDDNTYIPGSGTNDGHFKASSFGKRTLQENLRKTNAEEFDPTRTNANPYLAGEKVGRNGKLYVFKVDHYGAWSDGDVLELSAAVAESIDVVVSKNLLPVGSKSVTINDVSSSYEDGILSCVGTANANGGRTTHATPDFILDAGTYTFTRSEIGGVGIVLQDSSNNILTQLLGTTTKASFTINADTTCYIGISTATGAAYNSTYNLQVVQGSNAIPFEKPSFYSITAKDNVARGFNSEVGVIYETPTLSWTDGKAFIYNAGWSNNTGWSYADVELTQGQSLVIKMQAGTVVYPLSVWNDDGTDIIKVCFPLETTAGTKDYVYKCSAQHEKVRINVLKTEKNAVVAKVYKPLSLVDDSNVLAASNTFKCYDVLFKEKGIIAIGDSLTQGSYTGYDIHASQSYPSFLADMMGVNVENAGRAGWSTLQWWQGDAGSQKGFPYYDYTEYNAAVICLGTNGGLTDTLDVDVDPYNDYHDYANTNTGAYCKIIEGMRDQNSGLQIVLCTIWATGADLVVTNSVIKKIAAKYGLSVVDLTLEFSTNFSAFRAVQGNIHLGRIGYARMADLIRIGLEKDVMAHPSGYNFIPS